MDRIKRLQNSVGFKRKFGSLVCASVFILVAQNGLIVQNLHKTDIFSDNAPLAKYRILRASTKWHTIPAPSHMAQHVITEGLEWNSTVPHNLWFTYKTNILETKRPRHFFRNVQNTIKLYTKAFLEENEEPIHSTAMDNEYCQDLIEFVYPKLSSHFVQEDYGAFKGDICRIAALYLHGGYYFDVDMEVIQPFLTSRLSQEVTPEQISGHPGLDLSDLRFATVWSVQQDSFFQSFMASTPGHPILKRALEILYEYYEGRRPSLNGTSILGPLTLLEAYRDLSATDQTSESPIVTLEDFQSNIPEGSPFVDANTIRRTSFFLQELPLQKGIYGTLRRRNLEDGYHPNCNIVVHNPLSQTPYFYARILGSSNCPFPTTSERLYSYIPFVTIGTCGGGNVGNGVCYSNKLCCSQFGYCGDTPDYCAEGNRAPMPPQKSLSTRMKQWASEKLDLPTCGEGDIGNSKCYGKDVCCSKYGWCGTGEEYCENQATAI